MNIIVRFAIEGPCYSLAGLYIFSLDYEYYAIYNTAITTSPKRKGKEKEILL